MMGIAFWCVWAAYTTTELPETAASTMMSLSVAADAAEPPEVVALAAVFPEPMVPAAVSPEVAALAAEPPEAAVLASAPCVVVAPSNTLSACHVTVEGTIAELSLHPDGTTVEPPEVAASAADPLEVSVVPTYELSFCPITAMEAICDSSSCPVTDMEAVCESSSCSVTATEAAFENLPCSEPAEEAISELSRSSEPAMVADCELSVLLVSVKESKPELFDLSSESINAPHICPLPVNEFNPELSVCPVSTYESEFACSVFTNALDFELFVCPVSMNEPDCELFSSLKNRPVQFQSVHLVMNTLSVRM